MVRIRVMSSSNHNTSVFIVAKQRMSGSDIAADRRSAKHEIPNSHVLLAHK